MKNANIKQTVKAIVLGLLSLLFVVAAVGCGKDKKSSGGANPYGYGIYGRYGQPGYGGYGMVTAVTAGIETSGRAMVILATSADPNSGGMYGMGQTWVEGELHVNAPMGCMASPGLGLNPGIYQLMPAGGMAMLNVDFLQNVVLIANGPYGQALITIPFAKFFMTNVCGMNGMQGEMSIESVNGFNCGIHTGFSDMMAGAMCGY